MSIAEKLQTIAENEQRVYEAGKAYGETVGRKAQHDEFWDAFQQNGDRRDYNYAFYSRGWNDTTYNPKYPITTSNGNGAHSLFAYSRVTDTKVAIDISGTTSTQFFHACYVLVTIRKLILGEQTKYTNAFNECTRLENLTIEGTIANTLDIHWSTKLSKASITSVMNALSTSTSGLTVVFSKEAVDKDFETASGANDGTTSTEWLALVATKNNWTISLV